ncbi:MAG: hypothetical protein AB8B55_24620 [Mariniblastus sp.]
MLDGILLGMLACKLEVGKLACIVEYVADEVFGKRGLLEDKQEHKSVHILEPELGSKLVLELELGSKLELEPVLGSKLELEPALGSMFVPEDI